MGRYGEIRGDVGRCREMKGDIGRYRSTPTARGASRVPAMTAPKLASSDCSASSAASWWCSNWEAARRTRRGSRSSAPSRSSKGWSTAPACSRSTSSERSSRYASCPT